MVVPPPLEMSEIEGAIKRLFPSDYANLIAVGLPAIIAKQSPTADNLEHTVYNEVSAQVLTGRFGWRTRPKLPRPTAQGYAVEKPVEAVQSSHSDDP